jgi:hypothetical protein
METRLTLRPGQNGTRKLAERFGKRLVRVRYRYDETLRRRYTTVELIVAESAWTPRSRKPRSTRPTTWSTYASATARKACAPN